MSPEVITGIIIGGFGLAGALVAFMGTRGKTQADAKAALDSRIDQRVKVELDRVYKRLDEVEDAAVRRTSAFARILRSIAAQWPTSHGPDLDPNDIREIEDTIPPQWIRKNPYIPKETP